MILAVVLLPSCTMRTFPDWIAATERAGFKLASHSFGRSVDNCAVFEKREK